MPLKLHIIIASTRPGRVGSAVAKWFHAFAVENGRFEAELVDLVDFNLPIYDEPVHHLLERLAGGQARVFMGELAGIKAGTLTFSPLMGSEINARGKAPLQLPFTRKCYDVHACCPLGKQL